jgi:hypothetical protein
MVYFSIDNDHHTNLALLLIEKNRLQKADVMFISHRSPRNHVAEASGFAFESVDVHPLCSGLSFKNLKSYWRSYLHQARIARRFQFRPEDLLVITTEYEINNALLAAQMRRAGGRVYLYDEGIGFYFNNSIFHNRHLSWNDRFFLVLYNLAFKTLGIPAYAKKGFEGRMYVRIREHYLDAIYSRMRLPIDRPAEIRGYRHFLVSEQAFLPKNRQAAIFFANNLDAFGLKAEELAISGETLRQMARVFSDVHLKIHPGDWAAQNDICRFYVALAAEHANIHLVDNAISGNAAMERIKPRVVVGTMGAAMFDAFFFGCQPIFLFRMLPPVKEFGVCNFTLENLGYHYIASLAQINPGYESGVDISSLLYDGGQAWSVDAESNPAQAPSSHALKLP